MAPVARRRDRQVPELVVTPDIHRAVQAVRDAEKSVVAARAALGRAQAAGAKIRCGDCGHIELVATQVIRQTHWYTPPRGCTEGDYWNQGELQWDCPTCRRCNRFENRSSSFMHRPELASLKHMFARVIECYCRPSGLHREVCEECQREKNRCRTKK